MMVLLEWEEKEVPEVPAGPEDVLLARIATDRGLRTASGATEA